jgi:hypothetical protein
MLPTQLAIVEHRFGALVGGRHAYLERLQDELDAYFAGSLSTFNVPVVAPGSPFEEQVWSALREIPPGETRSYDELALALGRPGRAGRRPRQRSQPHRHPESLPSRHRRRWPPDRLRRWAVAKGATARARARGVAGLVAASTRRFASGATNGHQGCSFGLNRPGSWLSLAPQARGGQLVGVRWPLVACRASPAREPRSTPREYRSPWRDSRRRHGSARRWSSTPAG